MAKPKIPNSRRAMLDHGKRVERYGALITQLYDKLNKEAAKLALSTGHDPSQQFLWSDYPETKAALQKLQTQYVSEMSGIIMAGTSEEWRESNLVQDLVAKKVLKEYTGTTKSGEEYKRYFETDPDALKAFQRRRDKGMNLSTRVWNLSEQYKTELEMSVSAAIEPGTSAMELAAGIKKYLNEPDMMFRRFRYKDEEGNWKKKWKQKVTDADGKVRFIDADPRDYHPGRGVYRSSARNAQRLARTEINMAYRAAEQERWKQFDFVVGYEVKITQNGRHVPDICDELVGKYPKTFKFMGFHPHCLCYSIPILKTEDEFFNDDEDAKSVNEVEDVPDNFKNWVKDNADRIEAAQERGTLPYFIRDNYSVVDETMHPELKQRRLREEAEKRAKEEAKRIAMEEAGQVVSNVLPICEATTPKEAIDFILENIADNCSLDIKKKDLPIINEVINQLNQRNHEYGLGKFKDFGKPRSKGANASWDEHDDSFNFNAATIEKAWKAEMKYRAKGISYSACNDSREDYVRYLVDHEYGHRLMSKYQMKTDAIATQTKGWKAMSKISYYSGTDIDEYFAEVFAAYKGSLRSQIREENLAMIKRLEEKAGFSEIIKHNPSPLEIAAKRHAARTPEREAELRAWKANHDRRINNKKLFDKYSSDKNYTDVAYDEESGGMKATHLGHEKHINVKEKDLAFGTMTPWALEDECQNILFKNGYSCILNSEHIFDPVTKKQRKVLDTTTDGMKMDMVSITSNGKNTVRSALDRKKKQLREVNQINNSNFDTVIIHYHDSSIFNEESVRKGLGKTFKRIICVINSTPSKVIELK